MTPRRTIARGLECLSAGDVLYVRGGIYSESLTDGETDFSGASWSSPTRIAAYNGERVVLKAPPGASFAIQIGRRHHVVFDGLEVDGTGVVYDAVKLNGTSHHIRFQNGAIYNATHQGVNIQDDATGHELIDLEIHDNGTSDLDHGIYIATSNNLVERSRIYGNSGYGVHVYNGACQCANGNQVRGNRIQANGLRARGFGIILGSGTGNVAANNVVVGNYGGIQVAHGAPRDTQVVSNTVADNGPWGGIVVQAEAVATRVANNIAWRSAGGDLSDAGSTTAMAGNLVGIDPRFVDPGAGNFQLQPTSAAIDSGVPLADVSVDFAGARRPVGAGYDAGAYEYGGVGLPDRPRNLRIQPF